MTNKVTWSDLLVPPINLYNMPKMNTPYLDDKVYPQYKLPSVKATASKFDQDKPRMDLLDADALEGLAKVLTFGANKYAAHNWRGGLSYSRLLAALLRHTFAILRGERNDPESGLPHIDHIGCCWMFASHMMKNRPDMDDLYSENNKGSAG